MNNHLLIRADANPQIGMGHLMRCLSLAQAWKDDGGEVTFITACQNESLKDRLTQNGMHLVLIDEPYSTQRDWGVTSQVIDSLPTASIVLDGYHFDTSYQRMIQSKKHWTLVLDDYVHLDWYVADAILNQNLAAQQLNYPGPPETLLLLGTKYTLLRREFRQWQDWHRTVSVVAQRILVTTGGSDTQNVVPKILHALQYLKSDLEIKLVIGTTNQDKEFVVTNSRHTLEILTDVRDMGTLMAWADLAISAAGSTCWELAYMMLPSVLIVLSDDQARIAEELDRHGYAINLGWHNSLSSETMAETVGELILNYEKRSALSRHGRTLVDGRGAARIVETIKKQ